jgi:hypothetical protein
MYCRESVSGGKSLEMKLALFDPELHGGDVTENAVPVGREFGAKARR